MPVDVILAVGGVVMVLFVVGMARFIDFCTRNYPQEEAKKRGDRWT